MSSTTCNAVLHPVNSVVLHPVNNHCSQLFTFNNHCSIIVDSHQQAFIINYCQFLWQQHCNNYCSLFNEIRLDFTISDGCQNFWLQYYNYVRSRKGEGVCIYLRDSINHKIRKYLTACSINEVTSPVCPLIPTIIVGLTIGYSSFTLI